VALAVVLLLFTVTRTAAQSNAVVDELLAQEEATFGPTAYIVLTAAGLLPEESDYRTAVAVVEELEWFRGTLEPNEEVRLGRFAKMVLEAFEIRGGLMYRLFGSPRYAARELAYRDYIRGSSASRRRISGELVIRVVGRVMADQS
jgi:hypothetical protein